MKIPSLSFSPLAAVACAALLTMPVHAVAGDSGSDQAFNEMIGTMSNRDTGSGWFDYYVETLNQKLPTSRAARPLAPPDRADRWMA